MKNKFLSFFLLIFCIYSVYGQKQYYNFPYTSIVIIQPEHFQPQQDHSGAYYLFHPGTNAVIQVLEQSSVDWQKQKSLFNEDYFASQNLHVKYTEERKLPNGIETMLFECETEYRSVTGESVPYKVMMFTGGKEQTTFLIVVRYPLIADTLLNSVMKDVLYSIELKK